MNKITEIQKEQIEKFYYTVYGEKKYFSVEGKLKGKLTEQISEMIRTELKQISPEVNDETEIIVDCSDGKPGSFSDGRYIDNNGNLVREPKITMNLGPLDSSLAFQNNDFVYETLPQFTEKFVKYIFHEIQHLKQDLIIDNNESSKDLITLTCDNAISKRFPKIYNSNYYIIAIEKDAQRASFEKYMEIMGEDPKTLKDFAIENMAYETRDYNVDDKELSKEEAYALKLDELICEKKDKELLKLYPPLLKIYNEDCTKKSSVELIKNFEDEKEEIQNDETILDKEKRLLDSQEMYYELIYNTLEDKNNVTDIKNKYGNEYTNNLIKDMIKYFKSEKERKLQIIDKAKELCSPEKVVKQNAVSYNFDKEISKYEERYDKKIDLLSSFIKNQSKSSFKDSLKYNVDYNSKPEESGKTEETKTSNKGFEDFVIGD